MDMLLTVNDLAYSYHSLSGETQVLDGISFSIQQGEFVAIVGPSGCGKSTLLSLICRLLTPDSGEILLEEGKKVGYMLQKDHLLDWRTTEKNVALGMEINHQLTEQTYLQIDYMLNNYGLVGFRKARPDELSGGMRQRAALIRTLLLEPDLLLLDEPFSALDYQTRLSVSDDIWKILQKENKTALLITHDISEAISMADRILVFSRRPAAIKKEIPVILTCPNGRTPFHARSAPEFKEYFNLVWKELNDDE